MNRTGEQDESAFDISQLKKPVDSPLGRFRAPAIEKVMPPPIPSAARPRKWGENITSLCISCIVVFASC